MTYIVLLSSLFFSSILNSGRIIFFINALFCVIFFGFSYASGYDWIGYFQNYDCIKNNICDNLGLGFEPGYNFLVYLTKFFSYPILILCCFLISFLGVFKFSRQFNNRNFILFCFFGVFGWQIYVEQLRQAIAISFCLLALLCLLNKDYFKFLLWVLLASMFHATSIIFLLFFFVDKYGIKFTKMASYFLLAFCILFTIFSDFILKFVSNFNFLPKLIADKLNFYIESDLYKPQFSMGIGVISDLILIVLFLFWIKEFKSSKYYSMIFFGTSLFLAFVIIGKSQPVWVRLSYYGYPLVVMMLGELLTINIKCSVKNISIVKNTFIKVLVYLYLLSQALRPFMYDYTNKGIFEYENSLFSFLSWEDANFRQKSFIKCEELKDMDLSQLCHVTP